MGRERTNWGRIQSGVVCRDLSNIFQTITTVCQELCVVCPACGKGRAHTEYLVIFSK